VSRSDIVEPELLAPADLEVFAAARARGASVRASTEELLRSLSRERREAWMQFAKESRGVWSLLLGATGGRVLFVGNPLSGAVVPLAALGLEVTLMDSSRERLELALTLAAQQVPAERLNGVVAASPRLPFADGAFGVVAWDSGRLDDALLTELQRVCAGELFVAVDNRLGYKRSSGRAWELRVHGPLEYALRLLRPGPAARTLSGWRRALGAAGFEPARALALYPDRRDFAQVVALDTPLPSMHLGPNERRNRVKMLGHSVGLFPHLTPSYALHTRRRGADPTSRLDRALAELAEITQEGASTCEHLIGTRGNVGVVMTAKPGSPSSAPRGRWLLHVPLYQAHRPGMSLHFGMLARMRAHFPAMPVPEPLFCGDVAGLWLCCERRLPGFGSHHRMNSLADSENLLAQASVQLATLTCRPAAVFSDGEFESELEQHFEGTLRSIVDPATRRSVEKLREQVRAQLVGRSLPRVIAHCDLRAKHVQLDEHGVLNGYLDWGTASMSELPGLDLLHLFVHNRKQLFGHSDGTSWRTFLDPAGPSAAELAAFEAYARPLGLDLETLRAVALFYPALVGSTAERNWAHARPDWFQDQFHL
jgi:hypothetical protein